MIVRTLAAAFVSFPLLVSAATYSTIDQNASQIQFHYEQMGVNMDGVFKAVSGDIHFDTTQPENAKASLVVAMNSVDTGSDEADNEVVKAEWFNADNFPTAEFTATTITPSADATFEVTGLLKIKGQEKEIRFPATVKEADNQAIFTGSFSLLRGDYAIGEGAWAAFDIVANDIRVDFTLVATQ